MATIMVVDDFKRFHDLRLVWASEVSGSVAGELKTIQEVIT